MLLLQRLDHSGTATALCTYEFILKVWQGIKDALDRKKAEGDPAYRELMSTGGPLYLWDNAKPLECAAKMLGLGDKKLPQPPRSPDFNRPVEHAHFIIQHTFQQEVGLWIGKGVKAVMERVTELIKEHITPDMVRRDVSTMHLGWTAVLAPKGEVVVGPTGKKFEGTAGDWPVDYLR